MRVERFYNQPETLNTDFPQVYCLKISSFQVSDSLSFIHFKSVLYSYK